jgi:DNA-binding transcriptional regulator YdaS (Cro superfamily)
VKILNIEDVLELLRLDIDRVGGQSEWARQTGVSRMQINRALNGRRMPPSHLCQALGLEWFIVRHIAGKDDQPQHVIINDREFLLILKVEIEKAGSITAWCDQIGVNRTYLSQVVNKRRTAGAKILAALNLSEVLVRATKSRAKRKQGRKYRPSGKRYPHARWPTS